MNLGAVGGTIIVLMLVGAGVFLWNATAPAPEETALPLPTIEEVAEPTLPAETPHAGATVSPVSAPETAPVSTATIAMDETGFEPKTITVKSGTAVTFVNNGQAPHWPASALHPTHQVLPGFDALRGLATGESYTYTFKQVGSWNYHDHLNLEFSGTVIVE